MIYFILSKENDTNQKNIINFIKEKIKPMFCIYKVLYMQQHIIESDLSEINENDYIFWHPLVAHNNLELVKNYNFSTVILQNKSLFIQKISKNNPINENMAINNGFTILYIDENFSDITNNEWKLVIHEDAYLITLKKFISLLLPENFYDSKNVKTLTQNPKSNSEIKILTQINFD